jgi:hypothetical protein
MAVQVDADDLAVLGEDRQHGAEHVDRPQPAVQQLERLAPSVDFVVVLDAVGLDAAACLSRWSSSNLSRFCGIDESEAKNSSRAGPV